MAVSPPPDLPAAQSLQQAASPPTAQRSGCFGRGCGCSCLGCLLVVVLIALLVGGSGWWFFVVQASASVNTHASLVVINQPITVDGNPAIPGQSLEAGSTVATGPAGHGVIDFPDGSYMRLAPQTTVVVKTVQLQKSGNVQAIALEEKVGRTFTNVQHLVNGASFSVAGHSVTAAVRGTQFEILVRPDHTNRIWVFVGSVRVTGTTSLTMTAGQEIDVDANGNLSNLRASQFDPTDPFPMAQQCESTIPGANPGTAESSLGDPLKTGQSAETDYYSSGGSLGVALCYPGSLMSVMVIDPTGASYSKQGPSPLTLTVPNGQPGLYKAVVRALSVPATGQSYAVAFATDALCSTDNVDINGAVRDTLSNSQIANALAEAGSTGVTLAILGTSPTSARVVYYSNVGGVTLSWTIDFYSASPDLGAVITQVTVHGVEVTTAVVSNLSNLGGRSISSIPSGFVVDRVYSCAGAGGDDLIVVEGHR